MGTEKSFAVIACGLTAVGSLCFLAGTAIALWRLVKS